MRSLTSASNIKGSIGKVFVCVLIAAIVIMAFAPVSESVVLGESTSGEAVDPVKYTVRFIDIDGTELKVEEVDHGGDATPPVIKAKKGYKFLGWNDWYVGVTSDRTIKAVYELVMTTEPEEDGKLGAVGTATPPVEKIAIATEGGLEVIDTSKEAITTPEIIKNNPTPTTVIEEDDQGLSTAVIVLIAFGSLAVLAAIIFAIMFMIKKRKKEQIS